MLAETLSYFTRRFCSLEFWRPAKRPAYSVRDAIATEAITGAMPRWRDNVAAVLDARRQNA